MCQLAAKAVTGLSFPVLGIDSVCLRMPADTNPWSGELKARRKKSAETRPAGTASSPAPPLGVASPAPPPGIASPAAPPPLHSSEHQDARKNSKDTTKTVNTEVEESVSKDQSDNIKKKGKMNVAEEGDSDDLIRRTRNSLKPVLPFKQPESFSCDVLAESIDRGARQKEEAPQISCQQNLTNISSDQGTFIKGITCEKLLNFFQILTERKCGWTKK